MKAISAALAAFLLGVAAGPASAQGPTERIGDIHWYGVPARCIYQTPEARALYREEDPETWRFVFLTMNATGADGFERGYILVDGALRELEPVRSGLDTTRRRATVWRSAGEPRLNVNVTLGPPSGEAEQPVASGKLTLAAGDGRQEVDIVGHCRT